MSAAETITLGCRLNFAESEALRARAPGNMVIVNSCAVTAEAVRQTRQAIRRARRDRPEARIVVTGCAAELDPEGFAAMTEVDLVLGNGAKGFSSPGPDPRFDLSLADEVQQASGPGVHRAPIVRPALGRVPQVPAGFRQRVRSFVAVQTGCDHRCTFCTIWTARGPSVTLPYPAVREAVAREIGTGAAEIVLTGVDITAVEGGLGRLCARLLGDLPQLKRLRLSSLDSVEIDDELPMLGRGT